MVRTNVGPADIVAHDDENIGLLRRGLRLYRSHNCGGDGQHPTSNRAECNLVG